MDSTGSGAGGGGTRPGLVLAIVCAGVVMASLDLFIVNVALPQISHQLGAHDLGELSWVLNGYTVVYAALLVLAGRLADRHQRKYGFLLGVALFTAASAACGAATSVPLLVGFRVVQAAGAALLTPTSLSLVLAAFPPQGRAGAVRTWTAIGGVAAALGPVVGGLLVAISWRWVFLVNLPIGIAALVIGWARLPDAPGHPGPRPDLLGSLLVTLGVGGLSLALVNGGGWGWGSPVTLAALVGSLTVLAAFALHCLRHHNPLLDPGLFRVREFSASSVMCLLFSVAFGAMLLSVVLWGQGVWGWSALTSGLALVPGPLMVPLFAFTLAGRLGRRVGPGPVMTIGSVLFAVGVGSWALAVGLRPDYPGELLGGTLLTGAGVGLTMPTYMATATSSLPRQSFATGAAVVNMLRQVGLAIGVAVLVAVLGTPGSRSAELSAFHRGWLLIALLGLVTAGAGALVGGRTRVPAPRLEAGARAARPTRLRLFPAGRSTVAAAGAGELEGRGPGPPAAGFIGCRGSRTRVV